MKTAVIIAEYNPFHNGHAYQIKKLKDDYDVTHIAAIMSTSITQRAEIALFDMMMRAEIAVAGGVDVVFSFPYVYSAQSAEIFAGGGVRLADAIKSDFLAFGCEDDDLDLFELLAEILINEPDQYKKELKYHLENGRAFAVSRQKSLESILGRDLEMIKRPNNILALEYIKSLKAINSSVKPILIKRHGVHHDSFTSKNGFASAAFIRKVFNSYGPEGILEYMPNNENIRELILNGRANDIEKYSDIIKSFILMSSGTTFNETAYYENGLERRMKARSNLLNQGVESYIQAVSTSRYTKNRMRRIVINLILGYGTDDLNFYKYHTPQFIRLLCANANGLEFVKTIKEKANFNVVSNINKEIENLNEYDRKTILFDSKAYDLYHIFEENEDDKKLHPVIL